MILLRRDCLVFETQAGTGAPCSVHEVAMGLIGQSAEWLDHEMVQHAAQAVLHYFKIEKGQVTVSMAEFCDALERVLGNLGWDVPVPNQPSPGSPGPSVLPALEPATKPAPLWARQELETDLQELAHAESLGGELFFYSRLRALVHAQLNGPPVTLRFRGLRGCAKQLAGAKRWTLHCQSLQDQILNYLRTCLTIEPHREGCLLVVE